MSRKRRWALVAWLVVVMTVGLAVAYVSTGHYAAAVISGGLAGINFMTGLNAWRAPEIESVAPAEIALPESDDPLAAEILALSAPKDAQPSAHEDARIITALNDGTIRAMNTSNDYWKPRYVYSASHNKRLVSAHLNVSGGDIRDVYRRYLKALPVADTIIEQQKLVAGQS